jgi:hypothetical protein
MFTSSFKSKSDKNKETDQETTKEQSEQTNESIQNVNSVSDTVTEESMSSYDQINMNTPSEKYVNSDFHLRNSIESSKEQFGKSEPVRVKNNITKTPSKDKMQSMSNLDKFSKTNYKTKEITQTKGSESYIRSKSVSTISKARQKAKTEIQKDVDRTFQTEKYFKRDDVKAMLHAVLYKFTEKSSLKYVQGMNFIAAYVLHHSLDYRMSFSIFMFLQGG